MTEDLEGGFHFNTAISAIMELINQIYDVIAVASDDKHITAVLREAIESTIILLSPFVPHIAEEMWQGLGKTNSIFKCSWPSYDKTVVVEAIISIAIQVNGKLRSKIEVPFNIEEPELKNAVLSDPKVKNWVGEKAVRDFIIVPKKLVNVVV